MDKKTLEKITILNNQIEDIRKVLESFDDKEPFCSFYVMANITERLEGEKREKMRMLLKSILVEYVDEMNNL